MLFASPGKLHLAHPLLYPTPSSWYRDRAMPSPLIAVTASTEKDALAYIRSLETRGAQVRLFLPGQPLTPEDPLGGATAILLTGGPDIDASTYGEAPQPEAGRPNPSRDQLELGLLRHALARDLPVYGICRGMQLLNVAFGGRLIQDLPGHRVPQGEDASAHHMVYLAPGSKLAAIMGSGGFMRLNSRHHQGLREAQKSPHLLAAAYSLGDGVIEALESPAHDWVIALQCHPERESEVPSAFRRVFQAFVERAERRHG
ncbi:MAG: gamma-glutamyl-gamma-aminobutyrate hydrolase family protein [Chloroflexi bacterium]|nr:gamma-glutamyl-gamma-aminobutyrate hydrolase family protein [Chloroflexota bacterium]